MSEKEFVDGLIVKPPHERAPEFVKMGISIKVKDLGNWLRQKHAAGEEWVNLQVKQSQKGTWYAEVDNWRPDQAQRRQEPASGGGSSDELDDDIPFS